MWGRAIVFSLAFCFCNANDDYFDNDFTADANSVLSATEQKLEKYYADLDTELQATYNEDEPIPDEGVEVQKQRAALGLLGKGTISAQDAEEIREVTMRERIAEKLANSKGLTRSQRAQMRKDGLTMAALRNATAGLSEEGRAALNFDEYGAPRYMTLQDRKRLAKELLARKATGSLNISQETQEQLEKRREERTAQLYKRIDAKRAAHERLTRSQHTAIKQLGKIKEIMIQESMEKASQTSKQKVRLLKTPENKKFLQHYDDAKGWVTDHAAYMFLDKDPALKGVPVVDSKTLLSKGKGKSNDGLDSYDLASDLQSTKDFAQALDNFETSPTSDLE